MADYQQVLRTIEYDNSLGNPNTNAVTVDLVANDGLFNSNTAVATVTINTVNNTPPSTVVSRILFYDGVAAGPAWANPAGPDANDNAAISNRVAMLPGMAASQTNEDNAESVYTNGITGVMIDLSADGNHTNITTANVNSDFAFRIGMNNGGSLTWSDATTAQTPTVNTIIGGGAAGSDRVELFWPDNAVRNAWLQVEVLPNADTGLADLGGSYAGIGDIFYFANKVGDTGNDTSASFKTQTTDIGVIKAHLGAAPIDSFFDINKNGLTQTTDFGFIKSNLGNLPWLDVSGSPGPLAPASGGGDSGVSSALASTSSAQLKWLGGRSVGEHGRLEHRFGRQLLPVAGLQRHGGRRGYTRVLAQADTAVDRLADNLGLDDELLDLLLAERRAE